MPVQNLIPKGYESRYLELEREQRLAERGNKGDMVFLDPIELLPIEPTEELTIQAEGNWAHQFYQLTEERLQWIRDNAKRKVLVIVLDTDAKVPNKALEPYIWPEMQRIFTGEKETENNGHGGHVASCIAGTHPEGLNLGVASALGDKLRIAMWKVLRKEGYGYLSQITDGYREAIRMIPKLQEQGYAVILNASYGGRGRHELSDQLISKIEELGALFVAAAGNTRTEGITSPSNASSAHAIAALMPDGSRAGFSSYGEGLYMAAPGSRIFGVYNEGFAELSGTSMASPTSAGMAAIWLSTHPQATARQASHAMRYWATDLGEPGWDKYTGWGHTSVEAIQNEDPLRFPDKDNGNPETPNYEPEDPDDKPEDPDQPEEPPKQERELLISLPGSYPFKFKAFGDGDFKDGQISLQVLYQTTLESTKAEEALRIGTAGFFTRRYFIIPKGGDIAEAGFWVRHFYQLMLRRQGYQVAVEDYWIHDGNGAMLRLTRETINRKGGMDLHGVYTGVWPGGRDSGKKDADKAKSKKKSAKE